ncbi:hypothetical protein V2J09_009790 [Rumex salicifolius]
MGGGATGGSSWIGTDIGLLISGEAAELIPPRSDPGRERHKSVFARRWRIHQKRASPGNGAVDVAAGVTDIRSRRTAGAQGQAGDVPDDISAVAHGSLKRLANLVLIHLHLRHGALRHQHI